MSDCKYTCPKCGKEVKVEQKSPSITLVYTCCNGKVCMEFVDKDGIKKKVLI